MTAVSIKPDYREFISENTGLTFMFVLSVLAMPVLSATSAKGLTLCVSVVALVLTVVLAYRYIVLVNVVWIVNDDTLCRIKGVFVRRTDYLELYRVVDYGEFQSWLQKLLSVKTVTIISTDKTDCVMDIYGVPESLQLVQTIRERVEKCKKDKRIYEIANR